LGGGGGIKVSQTSDGHPATSIWESLKGFPYLLPYFFLSVSERRVHSVRYFAGGIIPFVMETMEPVLC